MDSHRGARARPRPSASGNSGVSLEPDGYRCGLFGPIYRPNFFAASCGQGVVDHVGDSLRVYLRQVFCELRRYWAGKRGVRDFRCRHYARERRSTTVGHRHHALGRTLPPPLRPKAPHFDSPRFRFDDTSSAMSDCGPTLTTPLRAVTLAIATGLAASSPRRWLARSQWRSTSIADLCSRPPRGSSICL